MSRTKNKSPAGLSKAITAISKSETPLKLWLRTRLLGNAVNEVLALPRAHRKPTGSAVLVGVYSKRDIYDADMPSWKAMGMIQEAVLKRRKRVLRGANKSVGISEG